MAKLSKSTDPPRPLDFRRVGRIVEVRLPRSTFFDPITSFSSEEGAAAATSWWNAQEYTGW